MADDLDELRERAARLSAVLEANWSEEFVEALSEEEDAASGFALARAVTQGWVTPVPDLDELFDSAEVFADEQLGDDDDDDDE